MTMTSYYQGEDDDQTPLFGEQQTRVNIIITTSIVRNYESLKCSNIVFNLDKLIFFVDKRYKEQMTSGIHFPVYETF